MFALVRIGNAGSLYLTIKSIMTVTNANNSCSLVEKIPVSMVERTSSPFHQVYNKAN